ncbi:MAG: hypothetical protein UU67_C0055G0003 [Candidatus Daviesbacteria bacterium GW2011_GWB1_41_5]|uniref:Uncharacterized protein n=1 Tax=Candidatus Daviesbacteria bacterium GW2011_GWB1_41_5 TaxID=1618429 RepID=A0A0G0ZGY6_9BACT|nr:MAG: hypothetical protein UU67_C0055G0003 [Candidatus Daviesbacteria bacterium GW2011_GWB1_41_5]
MRYIRNMLRIDKEILLYVKLDKPPFFLNEVPIL